MRGFSPWPSATSTLLMISTVLTLGGMASLFAEGVLTCLCLWPTSRMGGLYQPTNYALIDELMAVVHSFACPWLLAADFNVSPSALVESGIPRMMQGHVVATHEATISTGGELDFLVVSAPLVGSVSVEVQHTVPFKPHYGLNVVVKNALSQVIVPSLNSVDAVPKTFGPRRPWSHFATDDGSYALLACECLDAEQETMTKDFVKRSKQAEAFLLDASVEPLERGRGYRLEILSKAKVESRPPHAKWDCSELNFWAGVQRLVHDLRMLYGKGKENLMQRLLLLLRQQVDVMPKFWRPGFEEQVCLVDLQYDLKYILEKSLQVWDVVQDRLKEFFLHSLQQRKDFYKAQFNHGLATVKQMHSFLRKEKEVFMRPYQDKTF